MSEMLCGMMSSEDVKVNSLCCLYENEEVMVEHTVINFPDGSCEDIVGFNRLKDNLIIEMETGVTSVAKLIGLYPPLSIHKKSRPNKAAFVIL